MTKSSDPTVPCASPGAQYRRYRDEIDKAMQRVLESGWYILGKEVDAFESQFASYCGVSHCIGVANGTDALELALRALGVGVGDEVITVSHSAVATVAAIEVIGAVPVFVDIEPGSRCMDPGCLEGVISERTKAIIPVHIYGHPAQMDAILSISSSKGIPVIEDCAQAHGAQIGKRRVGSFGACGAFSFYPTKNLGAIGDGGAIVTESASLAASIRSLRQYGWQTRYLSASSGMNSRLDELQAAVLSVKLANLDRDNERRRSIGKRYTSAIGNSSLVVPPLSVPGTTHAMHLYVVESEERDRFKAHLESHRIQTGLHYPWAIHQQPAYKGRIKGWNALPVTERFYTRHLSLPMFPELTEEDVDRVVMAIESFR